MRFSGEGLYALLIVIFVWVSLFGHWLPMIHSILFGIVLLLEIAMIGAGWYRWIENRKVEDVADWRQRVGLLGVAANTTASVIPVGSVLYMMFYPFIRVGVRLPMIDASWMILACLAFSVCGLLAGVLAPPRSRFATAFGGLIIASIVLSIPMGVL